MIIHQVDLTLKFELKFIGDNSRNYGVRVRV